MRSLPSVKATGSKACGRLLRALLVAVVVGTLIGVNLFVVPWDTRSISFDWGITATGATQWAVRGASFGCGYAGSHWRYPIGATVHGRWVSRGQDSQGNLTILADDQQTIYAASGHGGNFSFVVPGSNLLGTLSDVRWYTIWIGECGNVTDAQTYMFGNTTIHQPYL